MLMKLLFTLFIFLAAQYQGHAQFSESFENWSPVSQAVPFVWEEPVGWSSSNPLTEFIHPSVVRDSDSYDGEYAARIQSSQMFDLYQPGILILGFADRNYLDLSMKSSGEAYPLDREPILLRGWYKYKADFNEARAMVQVSIIRYIPNPEQIVMLTDIVHELTPTIEYSEFQIPISMDEVFNPNTDQLRLSIYSHKPDSLHNGEAVLKMDKLSLDFVNASGELVEGNSSIVFPNPVLSGQSFQIALGKTISTNAMPITIYNSSGNIVNFVNKLFYEDQDIKISTQGWKPGVYFIYQYGNVQVEKVVVY